MFKGEEDVDWLGTSGSNNSIAMNPLSFFVFFFPLICPKPGTEETHNPETPTDADKKDLNRRLFSPEIDLEKGNPAIRKLSDHNGLHQPNPRERTVGTPGSRQKGPSGEPITARL